MNELTCIECDAAAEDCQWNSELRREREKLEREKAKILEFERECQQIERRATELAEEKAEFERHRQKRLTSSSSKRSLVDDYHSSSVSTDKALSLQEIQVIKQVKKLILCCTTKMVTISLTWFVGTKKEKGSPRMGRKESKNIA